MRKRSGLAKPSPQPEAPWPLLKSGTGCHECLHNYEQLDDVVTLDAELLFATLS